MYSKSDLHWPTNIHFAVDFTSRKTGAASEVKLDGYGDNLQWLKCGRMLFVDRLEAEIFFYVSQLTLF